MISGIMVWYQSVSSSNNNNGSNGSNNRNIITNDNNQQQQQYRQNRTSIAKTKQYNLKSFFNHNNSNSSRTDKHSMAL
eukprot:UN00258